jgi:predicted secreted acid phosphatase
LIYGQEHYQELLRVFKELKSSDVWDTLQDHWILYQKKHYASNDNQVEELMGPEEECEASDKDDWQIDMPDGDEIDDFEEASVDDDSPLPRKRQRFSC